MLEELGDESKYLTCPPGFERGVDFGGGDSRAAADNDSPAGAVLDLASVLAADEEDELGIWASEKDDKGDRDSGPKIEKKSGDSAKDDGGDDGFEPEDTGVPVLKIQGDGTGGAGQVIQKTVMVSW